MRKLLFLIALGIIGAGQIKADPLCTANTLAFYEATITTQANGCNIGGLNFGSLTPPTREPQLRVPVRHPSIHPRLKSLRYRGWVV